MPQVPTLVRRHRAEQLARTRTAQRKNPALLHHGGEALYAAERPPTSGEATTKAHHEKDTRNHGRGPG